MSLAKEKLLNNVYVLSVYTYVFSPIQTIDNLKQLQAAFIPLLLSFAWKEEAQRKDVAVMIVKYWIICPSCSRKDTQG